MPARTVHPAAAALARSTPSRTTGSWNLMGGRHCDVGSTVRKRDVARRSRNRCAALVTALASPAMAKAFEKWTVLPHSKVEKLEDNLWRVEGSLPGGGPPRVMTVAKLADGRLVLHSAIALDDAEMKELEAFGTPAFLVIPNAGHRLDAAAYKERYPKMTVVAPAVSKEKVEQVVKVDDTAGSFGDDS